MNEELEHAGVKGMKWGVRKADKSSPGPLQSLAKKTTDKRIRQHENIRDKKGNIALRALAVPDRVTWGRNGRFEKYQNNRISELERSNEHIAEGRKVISTIILGPRYSRK